MSCRTNKVIDWLDGLQGTDNMIIDYLPPPRKTVKFTVI